jgi:hypothetical protein
MEEGRWTRWRRRCVKVEQLASWFSSEGEWRAWLGSAISCTELGTTNWSGPFRFMSVAILPMGWVTASLTVRVGLICWDNGQVGKTQGPSTSLRSGRDDRVLVLRFGRDDRLWESWQTYLARARTRVTSSGCSLAPIQSSTAAVTISVMRGSGKSRFSRNKSISRCSPNSPKSFSGSVTPSV